MSVANIKGEFSGGDLLLKDRSTGDTLASFRTGRPNEYDEYFVAGKIISAQSSSLCYIPVPNSGTIVNIQVVPEQAVTSAAVTFTAFISSTSAITASAITVASGATPGTVTSIAPSAENEVDEDEAVLVQSGGGATSQFNATVILTVRRT